MLEFVVLNPPQKRGGKRKKKVMAKTKRKKRRSPIVWKTGKSKGRKVKGWDSMDAGRRAKLIVAGRVKTSGASTPTTLVHRAATFEGLTPHQKKIAKLKVQRELGLTAKPKRKKRATKKRTTKKRTTKKRTTKKRTTKKRATKKRTTRKTTKKRATKKATRKKSTRKKSTRKKAAKKRAGGKSVAKTKKKKAKKRSSTRKGRAKKKGKSKSARSAAAKKAAATRKRNAAKRSAAAKKAARTRKRGKSKRVTLRKGRRLSSTKSGRKRRKKLIKGGYLSKTGRANPGKKRKKQRKNPGLGSVMANLRSQVSMGNLIGLSQLALGASAATILPGVAEAYLAGPSGGRVVNAGYMGVGLSALSTAIATTAASYAEWKLNNRLTRGMANKVALGGGFVTLLRLLAVAVPDVVEKLKLPTVRTPAMAGMADWVGLQTLRGMGLPGQTGWDRYALPESDIRGIGSFMTDEQLVRGESFAMATNQFHGMSGNGLPAGLHYPGQYGQGVGNWLETVVPGAPLDPGAETF